MRYQFRDLLEFIKDSLWLIVTVVIILFVMNYILTIQQNVGPSMEPTMYTGDIMLLNRVKRKFIKQKRYDIISFTSKESKYMVKRIIGLPGETVEYRKGVLYINNLKIKDEFAKITEDFEFEEIDKLIIGENEYFVVGDNRNNSLDSRYFGFVNKKDIIGEPFFRFWPMTKIKRIE